MSAGCHQTSQSQRPYPTKTRIKTRQRRSPHGWSSWLRDHIPPKQGLRLLFSFFISFKYFILRDHIPPKQGLRLSSLPQLAALNHLRDHIPPKQGLRLYFIVVAMSIFFCLRDHIPPKQGLRLNIPHNNLPIQSVSQRPYPTKTRIKTMLCTERRKLLNWLRDHIPPKQGLRL